MNENKDNGYLELLFGDSGIIMGDGDGSVVWVELGKKTRAEMADSAYMLMVAQLGMDITDERLRENAVGEPGTKPHDMLMLPLQLRACWAKATVEEDGLFIAEDGEFDVTLISFDGLVEVDDRDGKIAFR